LKFLFGRIPLPMKNRQRNRAILSNLFASPLSRHCEKRSDEAISNLITTPKSKKGFPLLSLSRLTHDFFDSEILRKPLSSLRIFLFESLTDMLKENFCRTYNRSGGRACDSDPEGFRNRDSFGYFSFKEK
jgi:hypothetical protein